MAKRPRISITERNQQTAALLDSDPRYRRGVDNPFGLPSVGIALKDPSYTVRWFNGRIMTDKVWRAKEIGWDPVRPEDLAHPDQIGAFNVSADGHIVRGERGEEALLKIPKVVYDARQAAKTERNLRDMRDFDKEKQRMVEATAAKFGGEAADYANEHVGPIGSVTTKHERIAVSEAGDE